MVKRLLKKASIFILALLLLIPTFPSFNKTKADVNVSFDNTSVLSDLTTSTINGKPFDLRKYPYDKNKDMQMLTFIEYAYSINPSAQGFYGLYVYMYNPKNEEVILDSELHSINLGVEFNEDGDVIRYEKFRLKLLSVSTGDYANLFFKFKIAAPYCEGEPLVEKFNSAERVYNVAEVEIHRKGETNAKKVDVSYTYKYKGYTKGYGPDVNAESTLTCESTTLSTIGLDVRSTVWRPKGNNGIDYTQDSLHSVYFAVNNDFIKEYGELYAVHATWLNAVLKPMLVTGNQEVCNHLLKYLGKSTKDYSDEITYMLLGAYKYDGSMGATIGMNYYRHGFAYNRFGLRTTSNPQIHSTTSHDYFGEILDSLYMIFDSGDEENSADKYEVSRKEILQKMKNSATNFGGELVNSKYSKAIFESVDTEWKDVTFTKEDIVDEELKDLVDIRYDDGWWQKLWGTHNEVDYSSILDGIKILEPINSLTGNITEDCNKYLINKSDYTEFSDYVEENNDNSTIYIFRYMVSDYVSQEATIFHGNYSKVDSNAYFFQETVNLDFDIIDLTFEKEGVYTVIPVVATPIDVVGPGTPPLNTTDDSGCLGINWEQLLIYIGIALLVLIAGIPLLVYLGPYLLKGLMILFKFIIKLIKLPFKLVSNLIKKRKANKNSNSYIKKHLTKNRKYYKTYKGNVKNKNSNSYVKKYPTKKNKKYYKTYKRNVKNKNSNSYVKKYPTKNKKYYKSYKKKRKKFKK